MIFNICAGAPNYPIGRVKIGDDSYSFDLNSSIYISGMTKVDDDNYHLFVCKQNLTINFAYVSQVTPIGVQLIGSGTNSYTLDASVHGRGSVSGRGGPCYESSVIPSIGVDYDITIGARMSTDAEIARINWSHPTTAFGLTSDSAPQRGEDTDHGLICWDGVRRCVGGAVYAKYYKSFGFRNSDPTTFLGVGGAGEDTRCNGGDAGCFLMRIKK